MVYSFSNRDEQRDTNKKRKLEKEGEDMAQTKARTYVDYQVMGERVCRAFFLKVVGCSKTMIENSLKSLAQGLVVYESRRKGTIQKSKKKGESISLFLTHFGEKEALPCPTGRGSTEDQPVLYLPLQFPKVKVHSIYNTCASSAMQCTPSFFYKVWKRKFPYLKCLTKRTNFCDMCLFLINHHMAPEYDLHLKLAREMRAHIKENIEDSISSVPSNGCPKTLHLSFDFAEAVRLPQFTDQPSAFFFHSGLKIDLFGVAIDTEGYQHTFVLPEGHWPTQKGANCILSMIWHVLTHESFNDVEKLILNGDNCSGQGKNRYFMWFCSWLPMVRKKLKEVEVTYGKVGHTRMFPDACFGLIKRAVKKEEVVTPQQLFEVVDQRSSECNQAVGPSEFYWFDWKEFLGQFYSSPVPSIMSLHIFHFYKKTPGVVFGRRTVSGETQVKHCLFIEGVKGKDLVDNWGGKGRKRLATFPLATVPLPSQRVHQLDAIKKIFLHNPEHH